MPSPSSALADNTDWSLGRAMLLPSSHVQSVQRFIRQPWETATLVKFWVKLLLLSRAHPPYRSQSPSQPLSNLERSALASTSGLPLKGPPTQANSAIQSS
eukprot:scaffold58283_cov41-Phaeocystis_antarctica.AAC.3